MRVDATPNVYCMQPIGFLCVEINVSNLFFIEDLRFVLARPCSLKIAITQMLRYIDSQYSCDPVATISTTPLIEFSSFR